MAASTTIEHPSVDDRRARGKSARGHAAPSSHTGWKPAADRPDPVSLLEEQDASRESDLVPVRHGRMMVSPFTFYRGAAKVMAADLKGTPRAGLDAQLCGDAHLSNFGIFASPERDLLFDLNDFDDEALVDFSARYADQNEMDYEAFVKAVRAGRLEAIEGI